MPPEARHRLPNQDRINRICRISDDEWIRQSLELIEAVEFDSDEFGNWVDLRNGGVLHLAHSLISAVKGKGAFRFFKDTASRLGLLKQWYEYRDEALEAFVRDWAEAHQVPLIDDTNTKAKS